MLAYITKWNIREEKYCQFILTDVMEIIIIELRKFKKYRLKDSYQNLNSWIEFIENPEVIDMSNKEIKNVKEVLEEISQDEHEQYLAELREKYIMDQIAIEEAGYDKGFNSGFTSGSKERSLQIAKKLLAKKMDLSEISDITGLSVDELKKL